MTVASSHLAQDTKTFWMLSRIWNGTIRDPKMTTEKAQTHLRNISDNCMQRHKLFWHSQLLQDAIINHSSEVKPRVRKQAASSRHHRRPDPPKRVLLNHIDGRQEVLEI